MAKPQPSPAKPSIWLRLVIPLLLVVAWFGAASVGGPYFGKISEVASNDLATFLPESAESTKANEEIKKFRSTSIVPAIIVFEKQGGLNDDDTSKINDLRAGVQKTEGVEGDLSPAIVSENKQAALLVVPIQRDAEIDAVFKNLESKLDEASLGFEHKIGGPASFAEDLQRAFEGIDLTLLLVALATVFVILLVVYRSPILPIIVLLTATAALSAAILVVWHLANAGIIELNGQVQGILFILVIGAATDYALLYLARLREELHANRTTFQATKAALKGSFESIIAAGGTVTLGLMCLLLSDLGSNKALGPVGGIGIAFAVLAALTFLPAVLLLFGRAAFWPRRPKYDPNDIKTYALRHKQWGWVGRFVEKHPLRIWISVTVLLVFACAGVAQLRADGVPQSDLVLGKSEARDAQAIISKHFPSGSGSPAYIIAKQENQQKIAQALDADSGIDSLSVVADNSPSGTMPIGEARIELEKKITDTVSQDREKKLAELRTSISSSMAGAPQPVVDQAVEAAAANIPSVESIAQQAYPFKDATPKVRDGEVLIEATLKDPIDSDAAKDTVIRLRSSLKEIDSAALVGGTTAIQYDTNQASLTDRAVIIPVVLAVITIILGLLLRSIIAPIVLLATTVLSFGATLGISAILFNDILGFPGSDPSVILFGFVFLVALGIDYNIFLMTRVREETIKSNVRSGTIKALVVTGGVITSAGIVLAATFAALGVIPVLFLAQLAFIVAFGVLLDTIIIRSLLVPALTLEIGKFIWWPSRISRKK